MKNRARGRHAKPHRPHRPQWQEIPLLLVAALLLALVVKTVLLQAFSIPSGSMQHTLEINDRVLVDKVVYRLRDVRRGEVVVFDGVDDWASESDLPAARGWWQPVLRAAGLSSAGQKDYIKRVIGLPGDRVMCCDAVGQVVVTPDGGRSRALDEPYLFEASDQADPGKYFCNAGRSRPTCPPASQGVLVPAGRLWVMGDHRGRSADSRAHLSDDHAGTVPIDRVVGRAFLVAWPLDRLTFLGVPRTFGTEPAPTAP